MKFSKPVEWDETPNGKMRRLRLGEIVLAKTLYGNSIRYNEVWVHRGSYLPFNTQNNMTAMTPNGEIWFQEGVYRHDYSMASIDLQHMFLYEMMHVWQHQRGMWVRTRGAFSWAVDYTYSLDKPNLSDYGMEQQACLVSDYWLLIHHGFFHTNADIKIRGYVEGDSEAALIPKYKDILNGECCSDVC